MDPSLVVRTLSSLKVWWNYITVKERARIWDNNWHPCVKRISHMLETASIETQESSVIPCASVSQSRRCEHPSPKRPLRVFISFLEGSLRLVQLSFPPNLSPLDSALSRVLTPLIQGSLRILMSWKQNTFLLQWPRLRVGFFTQATFIQQGLEKSIWNPKNLFCDQLMDPGHGYK